MRSEVDTRSEALEANVALSATTPTPIGLTIAGAAAWAGISRSEIYRCLADGRIQAVKSGRSTIILADSLRSYISSLPTAEYRTPAGVRAKGARR